MAAWAAAPWPLWALICLIGTPGGPYVPDWIHGPLAISLPMLAIFMLVAVRPLFVVPWPVSVLTALGVFAFIMFVLVALVLVFVGNLNHDLI